MITSASYNYTKQLQQRTSLVTTLPTKQNPLNHPPHSRIIKPADITYAKAACPKTPNQQQTPPNIMSTVTTATPVLPMPTPFDYQATLDRITKDIETNLKAKLDAKIANLQKSFASLEQKVDQKLQQHMETLKNLQADKATQDTHTKCLEQVTWTLDILVEKIHLILDSGTYPMPLQGIGRT